MSTYVYTCLHIYMSTYLHVYISTYLHVYISTCLHVYMSTCLHIYISTYLHVYISTYLHVYMSTCRIKISILIPRCVAEYTSWLPNSMETKMLEINSLTLQKSTKEKYWTPFD